MTNAERYRKDIEKVQYDFTFNTNDKTISECTGAKCPSCRFSSLKSYDNENDMNCVARKIKWLMSKEKNAKVIVDWSKVPVDTPVIWKGHKRHFAKYTNNHTYIWGDGKTSFTSNYEAQVDSLTLAEPHPEWMMEVNN